MSLPDKPPTLGPSYATKSAELVLRPEYATFLAEANNEYYSWDEIKRRPLPLGLQAAEAWMAVKMSRSLDRRPLPLTDSRERPFSFWLPSRAQKTLHTVDRQGGGTLGGKVDEPATLNQMRDRILIDSLMEEAIATSQIEGAVTTRRVAKDMLRSGRKPRDRSEKMIVHGYRTVGLLRDRLDRPLTIDLLHEIQESMTRDTLDAPRHAGRFRDASDNVCVVDARDNEVVHTPPPAAELPGRVQRLIHFANAGSASEPFIHPLVRASILHFWFAYEHPYVDGNGRTARALFYWTMLKNGYWLFEFLTISRIIHAAPMRYYRAFLNSAYDDNDLSYFLMFQFDVTARALADLHKRIHEIAAEQSRIQAIRLAAALNPRQRALLDHALRHPTQLYNFESHQRSHGITYQTARTDLLGLADRGLLVETGTRRPRGFLPAPDLPRKLKIRT